MDAAQVVVRREESHPGVGDHLGALILVRLLPCTWAVGRESLDSHLWLRNAILGKQDAERSML